jgi:VanZ family protein
MFDVILSVRIQHSAAMSPSTTRRLLWSLTLSFWAFIFFMTHIPQPRLPNVHVGDKSAHVISYGVLAALLYLTLWRTRPADWSLLWKIPLILMLYGAFDEITQPLVHRSCELKDWYADVIGAVLAVVLMSSLRLILSRMGRPAGKP